MMDKLLEHIVSVGLGHEVGGGDIVPQGPRPGVEHRLLVPVLHCELPDINICHIDFLYQKLLSQG